MKVFGKDYDDSGGDKVSNNTSMLTYRGVLILCPMTITMPMKMPMTMLHPKDDDVNDDHHSGSENGAGLSWEHGQLHPGLFSHHEYDYG